MLKIFIRTDEEEELKNSRQLLIASPNKKLRQFAEYLAIKKDGQIVEQARSEYKIVFNLKIGPNLQFDAHCCLKLENQRLSCQTKIFDYKLRKLIKEAGQRQTIEEINRMNLQIISESKILLKKKPELISIISVSRIDANFSYISYLSMLESVWSLFSKKFYNFYMNFKINQIEKVSESELLNLKHLFQLNRLSRPKATKYSTNFQLKNYNQNSLHTKIEIQHIKIKQNTEISESYEVSEYPDAKPILRFIEIEEKIEKIKSNINKFEGGSSVIEDFYYKFYKYTTSSINMRIFTKKKLFSSSDFKTFLDEDFFNELNSSNSNNSNTLKKGLIKSKQDSVWDLAQKEKSKQSQITKTQAQSNKIKCEEILIKKSSLKSNPVPFKLELKIIKYLKDEKCPYIASYYFDQIGYTEFDQLDRIFLDYYPFKLEQTATQKLLHLLIKVLKGIEFLNNRGVVHRDLKPPNILMDFGVIPKIIDFGSSTFTISSQKNKEKLQQYPLRTTRHYNKFYSEAPENVKKLYNRQQFQRHYLYDMYAFGRIVENFLKISFLKEMLGAHIYENLLFLCQKCCQENPDDRLEPFQAILFLSKLQKVQRKIISELK